MPERPEKNPVRF